MAASITENADLAFILQALFDGGDLSMDFGKVAKGAGITLSGNANRKFQQILKKYGYKYDKGESAILKLDGSSGVFQPTTPAKKTPAKAKIGSEKKVSAKKRKLEADESAENDAENGTSASVKESKSSGDEKNGFKEETD